MARGFAPGFFWEWFRIRPRLGEGSRSGFRSDIGGGFSALRSTSEDGSENRSGASPGVGALPGIALGAPPGAPPEITPGARPREPQSIARRPSMALGVNPGAAPGVRFRAWRQQVSYEFAGAQLIPRAGAGVGGPLLRQ